MRRQGSAGGVYFEELKILRAMQGKEVMQQTATPMLFPIDPEVFWQRMRLLVREEVQALVKKEIPTNQFQTPGMAYKPLFKISEVCELFQITRPTMYDWIKHGKLRPHKIRTRVYFLWNDVQQLLATDLTISK